MRKLALGLRVARYVGVVGAGTGYALRGALNNLALSASRRGTNGVDAILSRSAPDDPDTTGPAV